MVNQEDKWYGEGLKFGCTQCGQCCTGSPGYVWLSDDDIQKIAVHLQMKPEEVIKKYTRRVFNRYALLERRITFDCIFLKENHCTIYDSRPKQCKQFPWWPENLKSREAWEETAERCEGIREDAPLISTAEINAWIE